MTHSEPKHIDMQEIDGGWCVKVAEDGTFCIDVMKMAYNYRVVRSPIFRDGSRHLLYDAGYCYFGHGQAPDGTPRTMGTAIHAAVAAALAWDGTGDPEGYDKKVGT